MGPSCFEDACVDAVLNAAFGDLLFHRLGSAK